MPILVVQKCTTINPLGQLGHKSSDYNMGCTVSNEQINFTIKSGYEWENTTCQSNLCTAFTTKSPSKSMHCSQCSRSLKIPLQ